ncbi:hypothetical protein [Streptomyces sp. 4F14]|uniref:hypothetical protein n=1 Tax=Streptomyces sp. 4F14 TaxID=3394380 RepID=UPI003A872C5D
MSMWLDLVKIDPAPLTTAVHRPTHWDPAAEDRDLTELAPFFAKAAQEGKAVLGGVS